MKKKLRKNTAVSQVELEKKSTKTISEVFALWLSYSSGFSLLLGYGYLSGIGIQFGYSAKDLISSTSDFLTLVFEPLILISTKVMSAEAFESLVSAALCDWLTLEFVAIFIIAYTAFHFFGRTPQKKLKTRNWVKQLPELIVSNPSRLRVLVEVLIVAILGVVLKISSTILMYFFTISLLILLLIIPVFGYTIGKQVAFDHIIEPKSCSAHFPEDRNQKETKSENAVKTASCVRVLHDSKEVARGRVIAENSERIFLYIKDVGEGGSQIRIPKSFPIRNVIIERVYTENAENDVVTKTKNTSNNKL